MPRQQVPGKDASPDKVKTFLDEVINYSTSYRIRLFRTWERARLYYQGDQWLEEEQNSDPRQTPFWKPIQFDSSNWMPTPVQNEMVAPIQNEVARLVGVGNNPFVMPSRDDPKVNRAAKLGKDALLDYFEKTDWTSREHEGAHSMVVYGTWAMKAWWDIDFRKTVKVPFKGSLKCPKCDFQLANSQVPKKHLSAGLLNAHPGRIRADKTGDDANAFVGVTVTKAMVTSCLTCQQPTDLNPYTPTSPDDLAGEDFFGRPMGDDVPLGDVAYANISVFDWFPQNQGLEVNEMTCEEWADSQVLDLDVIRARWKNGWKVKAEGIEDIWRWHPIVGGSNHFFGGGAGADPRLFSHHARVRQFHKLPWLEKQNEFDENETPKLNKGRSLIMANNVVLLNDDLMIESLNNPGQFIPRIRYFSCPWELKHREMHGLSMSELLFPQQDIINTTKSQVMDSRHRLGSPKLLCEDGMDLSFAGFTDGGYNSDVWYYRPLRDGGSPPVPFGNTQMSGEWANEFDRDLQAIPRISGTMDVEIGDVPEGVTAASALMYTGEKAAERRKPRLARLRSMKRRFYTYVLELMHEFYREQRFYNVQRLNGRWSQKSFEGLDLMNQTDVRLEDEPAYDAKMFRALAIRDGLELGTITADTESAKQRINKALDIPTDINSQPNRQVEMAQDEWIAFCEDGTEPAVKKVDDVHLIHFQVHSEDWTSPDVEGQKQEAGWNEIELAIWGWEDVYNQLFDPSTGMEAQLKADPPPATAPIAPPDPATGQPDPTQQTQLNAQWQQQVKVAQTIAAMPKAMELRIAQVIMSQIEQAGVLVAKPDPNVVPNPGVGPTIDQERLDLVKPLVRFYAHFRCHYMLSQAVATAVAGGAQIPQASGGPETQGGMVPSPTTPSTPGAGAGKGAATASGSGGARP